MAAAGVAHQDENVPGLLPGFGGRDSEEGYAPSVLGERDGEAVTGNPAENCIAYRAQVTGDRDHHGLFAPRVRRLRSFALSRGIERPRERGD